MSVYTATAHIVGGREGRATAGRGNLDLVFAPPAALGGPKEPADGTNPEELFALGYGACFLSTLQFVARKRKMSAKAYTLDSAVSLYEVDGGFQLGVTHDVTMPDVDLDTAGELLREAHSQCVYSKAISGNIEVTLKANGIEVDARRIAA